MHFVLYITSSHSSGQNDFNCVGVCTFHLCISVNIEALLLFDFFGKRQKSQGLHTHTDLIIAVVPDPNIELTHMSLAVTPAIDEPLRISSVTESTIEKIVRTTPSSANVSSKSALPGICLLSLIVLLSFSLN